MKAKDCPCWAKQYQYTNHHKLVRVAEQLKRFHDEKKGK